MTESDFIKAIQLLFPKGNPLREFADFVSKGNSIENAHLAPFCQGSS